MKFFNNTTEILQVKDAGGEVVLGPFLPGTRELGPWYDISELSDHYREIWMDREKIGLVD